MESAAAIAVIVASSAVILVSVLFAVALGYVIVILHSIYAVTKRVQRRAREIGQDVQAAILQATAMSSSIFRSVRKKRGAGEKSL